ncbi:hypothetical protein ACFL1G_11105 [Planctomycetota bacterium]
MAVLVLRYDSVVVAVCSSSKVVERPDEKKRLSGVRHVHRDSRRISSVHFELATVLADSIRMLYGIHAKTDIWSPVRSCWGIAGVRIPMLGFQKVERKGSQTSRCRRRFTARLTCVIPH